MQIKRLHDSFYKNENRFAKPKQSFLELFKILKIKKKIKILDVGSANGELLYNLNKKFPECELSGYELLDSLIKISKKKLPMIKKLYNKFLKKKPKKFENIDMTNFLNFLIKRKFEIYPIKLNGNWNEYDDFVDLNYKNEN